MALPGTTNLSSLNLADNLTVGGTTGFVGAATHAGTETFSGKTTFSGSVTFSGTVTNSGGNILPGSLYAAAGTVTFASGIVGFNVAAAGFAVQLPAPQFGAKFEIINQIAATSGTNTITIPSGGTIYQGTVSGTVLNFTTVGQTATLIGLSSTQYRSMTPGTTSPSVS